MASLTFSILIIVEIDKRITFHKVLGIEYSLQLKKYSNTEYLVKSWVMIAISITGFMVTVSGYVYSYYTFKPVSTKQTYNSSVEATTFT